MKLFAWQPRGYGKQSFFVMAETEELAKAAVDAKITKLLEESESDDLCFEDKDCYNKHDFEGWRTDYYKLTVAEDGEVIMNYND